ncbi:MAG: tRNA threonylcarbamoyladenosine dehydratase [Gammaproteobacteria bacterium]
MPTPFARTEILLGKEQLSNLKECHLLVVGLGGVGAFAAEMLARAGIGKLTIVDHDRVAPSNLNRQLVALHSTLGEKKTAVMAARLRDINPELELVVKDLFVETGETEQLLAGQGYDYLLDCIDSIACKADLIATAQRLNLPIISAMGAGNQIDPSRVRVSRLDKTHHCPLAREIRSRLRKMGVSLKFPVVSSDEPRRQPTAHQPVGGEHPGRPRAVNGTISYMPALFGSMMAGEVCKQLINQLPS